MTAPVSRERLAAARVLVVGDAMLDRYWFGDVERISPEAPVPVVRVAREEERLGGAANVAQNVRALGARATLLTAVGDDEAGRRLESLLQRDAIDARLSRDARLQTIVKLRIIGRSQQLLRVDFESPPDHEVLAAMLAEFERSVPAHDAALLSDYGKGGLRHVREMIGAARAAGRPAVVDPKGDDYSAYVGATVVTPNRNELAQITGRWSDEADLRRRAEALREHLGLDALLVTRSEEGMTLFDAAGALHVAAQAREVYDVTGAGDTVVATLAALLGCGVPLRDAVPVANRAGGIVVGRFGTASVTYDELFARTAAPSPP